MKRLQGMTAQLRSYWPAALAGAVLMGLVFYVRTRALALTGGQFSYPLDDSYIHMSIAKNLANHGVWGVTSWGFSSASSSPLWTLLLASAFAVAGPLHELALWMNVALALGVLVVADRFAARRGLPAMARVSPSPHHDVGRPARSGRVDRDGAHSADRSRAAVRGPRCAHRRGASKRGEQGPRHRSPRRDCAALFGSIRGCLSRAAGRGTHREAARVAACRAPVPFGGCARHAFRNRQRGARLAPLPMSVVVKSVVTGGASFRRLAWNLFSAEDSLLGWLLAIAALLLLAAWVRRRSWHIALLPLAMFVSAGLLHAAFASVGWLFRYEAYLMTLGLASVAAALHHVIAEEGRQPRVVAAACIALAVIAAVPLVVRGEHALTMTWKAVRNIHDQQLQAATFLAKYYPGAKVAANDIGAISYFSDPRLLDTFGLADLEIGRARIEHRYDPATLEAVARGRGTEIAVVYVTTAFLPDGLPPPSWRWVGAWGIADNVVCGSDVLFFFAVAPGADEKLRAALRAFADELPPGVNSGVLPANSPDQRFDPAAWDRRNVHP
jgi:hypothetical protein